MTELTIPDFFSNKNVFITGGSGFIGKVLVEKLLRSCPKVKNIYLLLRPKKGRSPEERVKYITNFQLFDVIKATNPSVLQKIRVIPGDCKELGLGLSPEDRQFLIENINVVIHAAASVRFDDTLTDAILLNTRGTRELCRLALEIQNLEVLVHISTTYCNVDQKVIEERLYPAHADWEKTIHVAENIDRHTLNVLTLKYIAPLPNTYTFAKSLSEHVVHDLCNGKIPTVIFRPSIVISSMLEPFPGWLDNFNGPMALLVACGKGLVHCVYSDPNIKADYVPVDIIVRAILISAWKQATVLDESQRLELSFYNGSNCDVQPITFKGMMELGNIVSEEVPLDDILWYPNDCIITKCYYNYLLRVLLLQFIPAMVLDFILKLSGKKPMLFNIQKKIFRANTALEYFSMNQWEFVNKKCMQLERILLPSDFDQFSYHTDDIDSLEFFKNAALGARKYLLNEGDDLTKAKKHFYRMWLLSVATKIAWNGFLFWWIFIKINIVSLFIERCINFYIFLITED